MLEHFIEKKKKISKLSVGCMVAAEVSQLVFGCAYFHYSTKCSIYKMQFTVKQIKKYFFRMGGKSRNFPGYWSEFFRRTEGESRDIP